MNTSNTSYKLPNISMDKRCARAAFHVLNTWRPSETQDIHELILTVCNAMSRISSRTAKKYAELVSCSIRIGHFAGMNGRPNFKAAPASWFSKRWRCVSKAAVRLGIRLAKPLGTPATNVPK